MAKTRARKRRDRQAQAAKLPRCPASGKVRFADSLDAERAVAQAILASGSGNPRRREERAYRCPDCDGWHLTSKPHRPPTKGTHP